MRRFLSLGAGVQSSTLYLMAVRGEFPNETPEAAIFADTQWEPAGVMAWLDELQRIGGATIPIYRVTAGNIRQAALSGERFATMPLRVSSRGGGGRHPRQCTREYKAAPVTKEMRRLLGVEKGKRVRVSVECWMGISLDEVLRIKPNRGEESLMGKRKRWSSWKRAKLWRECARCFWCGCATVLDNPDPKRPPKNLATIDHLRPRHDPTRTERPRAGERRLVLACWACNNARDKGELAAIPRTVFYTKFGEPPLSLKSLPDIEGARMRIKTNLEKANAHPRAKKLTPPLEKSLAMVETELARRAARSSTPEKG